MVTKLYAHWITKITEFLMEYMHLQEYYLIMRDLQEVKHLLVENYYGNCNIIKTKISLFRKFDAYGDLDARLCKEMWQYYNKNLMILL